ncbi:MAG: 50S ribosomal protein L30 [Thermomicrobiales bacterium]|nr:50S ribosomal protein L30 [Thermomicrobiales bacterium]MCO5218773.1 50S ribosomal protein L30 [Thermomicrobiales bacterium]MCO5226008.1 50S ribosomal protein L30 [Thermomicrobiales bacterium]MCO5229123.1 50S ribosomal protein L30 [Thermomicrobiales bacterium]
MAKTQKAATGQLRITLVHSAIGRPEDQKNSVKSLGLRKLNQTVIRPDEPGIRGICNKISHLVTVEEVAGE